MDDLIDIGANLAHESFEEDLDAVINRAHATGVAQIVVTGSDADSNRRAAELSRAYPGQLHATAGLHPHHADQADADLYAQITASARDGQIVAVGETGLDFFRDLCPRPIQERVFSRQLEIAAATGLPVFLHQRDAHDRFIAVLREHRDALGDCVVHCFTADRRALFECLDLDCHIGITGWICDERRGRHLLDMVDSVPAERLMIETDAPYLMPRSIRPKPRTRRNEPMHLPHVLTRLAEARGTAPEALARSTSATARAFFRIAETPAERKVS